MHTQDLFAEFPPVSKAEWLNQIAKDLKGRPLEDLFWKLPDEGLNASPFVHADDFERLPEALSSQPNPWEICEDVWVSDSTTANRQALEALEGGAESLCFWLDKPLVAHEFEQLLAGVHLNFIGLHFAGAGTAENPGALFGLLENLARKRGLAAEHLCGSVAYDPFSASPATTDWRYLAELLQHAKDHFPRFKTIQMPVSSLSEQLRSANIYLEKLTERGVPAAMVADSLQFSHAVDKRYFLEIARLRALQLLWFNLLNAWNLEPKAPQIAAGFKADAYTDELYTNMIRATTMAMSAVLGGATRLTVQPYDAGREAAAKYPPTFGRRIARNVQHLLKMESALDEITDPAAGSFYIETLTQKLAEQAWQAFAQKG